MKIIKVIAICCLNFIQIIDAGEFRVILDDEIFNYGLDKRVVPVTDFFDLKNLHFEQIGDDNIEVGGYAECIKSMDPKLPLKLSIRTQVFDRATWVESPMRLTVEHTCPELLNPERFWYNITKLWTSCPPQKGDKWPIEKQSMDVKIRLPKSFPIVVTKGHFLLTQGVPGMEKHKFGLSLKGEFVPV